MSVGRVIGADGQYSGTGFFVEPRGLMLTCTHVARRACDKNGFVQIDIAVSDVDPKSPQLITARWLAEDIVAADMYDVALLELTAPLPDRITTLQILFDELPMRERAIRSYGFPAQLPRYGAPASGIVVGTARDPKSHQLVLSIRSKELTSGYSGAPIVDQGTDCVVAILKSTVESDLREAFKEHTFAVLASAVPKVSQRVVGTQHPLMRGLWQRVDRSAQAVTDFLTTGPLKALILLQLKSTSPRADPTPVEDALLEFIEGDNNLMLVAGAPGAGKSVLLRHAIPSLLSKSDTPLGAKQVMPVYLSASTYFSTSGKSSHERIAAALAVGGVPGYPSADLRPELQRLMRSGRYRFLIMLDGMDEINEVSRRADVFQEVCALGAALKAEGHLLLLTSRPLVEFEQQEFSSLFKRRTFVLQPVSTSAQAEYFTEVLGGSGADMYAQYAPFRKSEFGGLPLLLALAVTVYRPDQALPVSLLGMYEEYLRSVLNRNAPQRIEKEERILCALPMLAYASLSTRELTVALGHKILRQSFSDSRGSLQSFRLDRKADAWMAQVLDARVAIFCESGLLKWNHLAIRDFLAGEHIASFQPGLPGWDDAVQLWFEPNCREAVLFALLIAARHRAMEREALLKIPPFSGAQTTEQSVKFLCDAIKMGVTFAEGVALEFVEDAIRLGMTRALELCPVVFGGREHPYIQLLDIRNRLPVAKQRIDELVISGDVPVEIRDYLASELGWECDDG